VIPLLVLLLGSMATILLRFDRSIWGDEAWVANSVITSTLHGMFFYEAWAQTTPPLFLLLERIVVEQVGLSELTLRLLPLAFGLGAIAIFALLAMKLLQERFAFFATVVVAFSPLTIANSRNLKQYSGELFAACLVLLLSWNYLSLPTRSRYWALVGAACLLTGLSYSLVMILPVCVGCILLAETGWKEKVFRTSGFALIFGVALACLYFLFVRPNDIPGLHSFWENNFPNGGWANHLSFYGFHIVHVYAAALLPVSAPRVIIECVSWGFTALTVCGVAACLHQRILADKTCQFYLLAFSPLIPLVAINSLGKYPIGAGRTQIFLLPCIAIWLGYSAKAACEWLPAFRTFNARMSQARWLALGSILAVMVSVASAWALRNRETGNWEDTRGALKSIREQLAPKDLLYVHASLTEPVKLYFAMWQWWPAGVVFGGSGRPCCSRVGDTRGIDAEEQHLVDTIRQYSGGNSGSRVWVLATGRITHWGPLGRNDFESIDLRLRKNGCSPDYSPNFYNTMLRRYECQPPLQSFQP